MQVFMLFIVLLLMTCRSAGAAESARPPQYASLTTPRHGRDTDGSVLRWNTPLAGRRASDAAVALHTPEFIKSSTKPTTLFASIMMFGQPAWKPHCPLAFDPQMQLLVSGTYGIGVNAKRSSMFTGYLDPVAGLHADLSLGDLVFKGSPASLRAIPISTAGTAHPSFQPGFVIGLGTAW